MQAKLALFISVFLAPLVVDAAARGMPTQLNEKQRIAALNEKIRVTKLQNMLLQLQKKFATPTKTRIVGYYKFTDAENNGKAGIAYRALVRYKNPDGSLSNLIFQDLYRKVEKDSTSGKLKVLLDWGSYYVRAPNGNYWNINDDSNDGSVEFKHNTLDSSDLMVVVDQKDLKTTSVIDQVLTCSSNTNVKGTGTKHWHPGGDFIYEGTYSQDCPGKPKTFKAIYTRIDQAEGESIFALKP